MQQVGTRGNEDHSVQSRAVFRRDRTKAEGRHLRVTRSSRPDNHNEDQDSFRYRQGLKFCKEAPSHLVVPFMLDRTSGRLSATGALTVRQSALGLTPLSIFLGALRVEDAIGLKFKIVALAE